MPAVAITNVIPMARTPTTLAWVITARRLSAVGNVEGLRTAPMTISTTITPPRVYSWSFTPVGSDSVPTRRAWPGWG